MRVLLALVVATPAFAQAPFDVRTPDAAAKAKVLFDEGRALLAKGETDAACEKFRASWKLDQASGTALNLGECEERAGELRAAWGLYDSAARAAERKANAARASFARQRADALVPKLGRVQLSFADPTTTGITAQIDGRAVELATEAGDFVTPDTRVVVIVKRHARLHRFERTVDAGTTAVIEVPPMDSGALTPTKEPPRPMKIIETERYNKERVVVGAAFIIGGAVCIGAGVFHKDSAAGTGGVVAELVGIGFLFSSKEQVILRVDASSNGAAASARVTF